MSYHNDPYRVDYLKIYPCLKERPDVLEVLKKSDRKMAGKVTKYRRSVTLEPMNAYERHVIHAALQDVPGVNTYSIGTEPNRRVVVSYDRDKR